jgi:hypothetical protein
MPCSPGGGPVLDAVRRGLAYRDIAPAVRAIAAQLDEIGRHLDINPIFRQDCRSRR